jgi:ADP-heptose:LPS heptosyltransferase
MTTPKDSPQRILIVALDNLGDLVFTSALTPPLRERFPDASIDIWSKAYTADVARLVPHVGSVIAADPPWAVHPQRDRPSLGAFLRSVAAIRSSRYDVALLTGSAWRAAAAVWFTRTPTRIGGRRRRNAAFLTHVLSPDDPTRPVVQDQARLLAPLGIASPRATYALDASRLGTLRDSIAASLPSPFAALHPFAAVADKRTPLVAWIEVARRLGDRGLPVVWCGTTEELRALRDHDLPASSRCVDEWDGGSLVSTAATLSLASVFAGHDSGPLHVAASFGVPVLDVFVGGNPARYSPQGIGRSRVFRVASPAQTTGADILTEIDALRLTSAS